MSPSCHTATPTPCPLLPWGTRLPGRAGLWAGAMPLPAGWQPQGRVPRWGQRGHSGTWTSWAMPPTDCQLLCCVASHRGLAALCAPTPVPCRPHQLLTSFGDSPTPRQGTQGRSRAWLREPPARQAPGRGRTPEHQQQQINVPLGCDGAVMETVPWKPFPVDGKPPLAPAAPRPAPPGLHRDPQQPAPPQGRAASWGGGGGAGRTPNQSMAGGRGDGRC